MTDTLLLGQTFGIIHFCIKLSREGEVTSEALFLKGQSRVPSQLGGIWKEEYLPLCDLISKIRETYQYVNIGENRERCTVWKILQSRSSTGTYLRETSRWTWKSTRMVWSCFTLKSKSTIAFNSSLRNIKFFRAWHWSSRACHPSIWIMISDRVYFTRICPQKDVCL